MLEKELETYQRNKVKLIEMALGKFVLIKDDRIVDVYETEKDAIKRGITLYKDEAFLVKKIEQVEQLQNFASNLILCD